MGCYNLTCVLLATDSDSKFESAEEDYLDDEGEEKEVKKRVEAKKRKQPKGKKVKNVAGKKGTKESRGDGDDEKADEGVEGKAKDKVRKKPVKVINMTTRGSASKVHKLYQEMSLECRDKFSQCCFGHLIDMPPFTVNRTLMCAVLRRYLNWDVFDFRGYEVRCSLMDIALITGLSATPVVNPIFVDEDQAPGRLRKRYLGTGAVTEYKLLKAIRSLASNSENQQDELDDLLKMHMLYFITVFLLPNSSKSVDPKWIQFAEEYDKFNAYSWAFEVHRLLVESFSHMFARLGTPHFNAYGCLHVFTVWCYMHLTSLAPPRVHHVYPRLLAYKLESRVSNKGGVGNTTLKTYELKVDKCLKKRHFIVQVEVLSVERKAYKHHLPTLEDDPVKGSNPGWVAKRSAAIVRPDTDDDTRKQVTRGDVKEIVKDIIEEKVEGPMREIAHNVSYFRMFEVRMRISFGLFCLLIC